MKMPIFAQFLFIRFLVGFIALLPLLKIAKQSPLQIKKPGFTILRALSGTIAMLCFYTALVHIDMADAMMIQNTNPAYLPILVFCFFGIRTNWKTLIGILTCIIGTGFVIHPHGSVMNPYTLLAIGGSILTAFAYVSLRQISQVNPVNSILFYYFIIATVTSGALMFFGWQSPTLLGWLSMIGIGIIGLIYQTVLTKAMQYLPSRVAGPIMLSSVIFSGLFDVIFYHVFPASIALLGMGITTIGIIMVILFTTTHSV